MANPYATRFQNDGPDGAEIEVYDTRDGQGVRWFGARRCGGIAAAARRAEEWAADQWIAEAEAAQREAELAEGQAPVVSDPAEVHVGAHPRVPGYIVAGADGKARTAETAAAVAAFIARHGGAYWCDDTVSAGDSAAIARKLAALLAARPDLAPTPAPATPIILVAPARLTPSAAQVEAALFRLEEDARRSMRLYQAAGDREGAQIARRSERAYRDAAGDLATGSWLLTARGDVLITSSSRPNVWHRVGRRPAASDSGYSPIVCSCTYGRRSSGLGPCRHQGFYEGVELAQQDMVIDAAVVAFGLSAD